VFSKELKHSSPQSAHYKALAVLPCGVRGSSDALPEALLWF